MKYSNHYLPFSTVVPARYIEAPYQESPLFRPVSIWAVKRERNVVNFFLGLAQGWPKK
jgi:hypothetical protein